MNVFLTRNSRNSIKECMSIPTMIAIYLLPKLEDLKIYKRIDSKRKWKGKSLTELEWKTSLMKVYEENDIPLTPPFLLMSKPFLFTNAYTCFIDYCESEKLPYTAENYSQLHKCVGSFIRIRLYRLELCKKVYSIAQSLGNHIVDSMDDMLQFFKDTTCQTKHTNECRKRNGRSKEATTWDITIDSLLIKYINQKGRCHISFQPLILKHNADYICSVERINSNVGETIENTVLICREFNIGSNLQFTRELLQKCIELKDYNYTDEEIDSVCKQIDKVNTIERTKVIMNEDIEYNELRCQYCGVISNDKFDKYQGCSNCVSEYSKQCRNYPHDYVVNKLASAKLTSENKHKRRKKNGTFDLTLKWYIDRVRFQRMKCAISGVPLVFGRLLSFRASIERLENSTTYIQENCVLVALEFNTSKQWIKEKYERVCTEFLRYQEEKVTELEQIDQNYIPNYDIKCLDCSILQDISLGERLRQGFCYPQQPFEYPIDSKNENISLPDEEWREIPEFSDYRVSNLGRLYRLSFRRLYSIQKPRLVRNDDYVVTARLYLLVANAFLPPYVGISNYQIVHIDNNKQNNNVNNLTRKIFITKLEKERAVPRSKRTTVRRKVYKYDITGQLRKVYESVSKASKDNNGSHERISNCRFGIILINDFIFSYENESSERIIQLLEELQSKKKDKTNNPKIVFQYNLDNTYVATHNSIRAACRATGVDSKSITECRRGDRRSAKGFLFRAEATMITDEDEEKEN